MRNAFFEAIALALVLSLPSCMTGPAGARRSPGSRADAGPVLAAETVEQVEKVEALCAAVPAPRPEPVAAEAPAPGGLAPSPRKVSMEPARPAEWDDVVYREDGLIKCRPYFVDRRFRNESWPADEELGFWRRANHAIDRFRDSVGVNTTLENEKGSYPQTMFAFLAGRRDEAVKALQTYDGEQKHTKGYDLYWCFTLKGQMRKHFYFGRYLDPAYRAGMREQAKAWTSDDPRPTLELSLALASADGDVKDCALSLLRKMKVPRARVEEMAKEALASDNDRRRAFGRHMLSLVSTWPAGDLGSDPARWREWVAGITAGDWMVYEEYERLVNPRPHPEFGVGTGPVGATWDPRTRGGWVDARNTDNLRAMRETSVYLMAEEAGNETVRKLYREKIRRYVRALYTIGMGEWDSENYHAHTMAAYLNLYDFARDPEAKLLGKAALDWLAAAGALKYYRGGFGGPTKRDYGGACTAFGSGPTHMLHLWIGDSPVPDPDPHYDDIHAVTSAYRPPRAVVALGRKDFPKPVELLDTKPAYSNWNPGADRAPEYWETMYFDRTYYLGTVVSESGAGDVGAFKLLAWNPDHGVDYFLAGSGRKLERKEPGTQIGHYRNLCVMLRKGAGSQFTFQVPRAAVQEEAGGVWFLRYAKTWLAVRKLGLGANEPAGQPKRGGDRTVYLRAGQTGGGYSGFALEVGEEPVSYDDFKRAIMAEAKLDASGLDAGRVALTGTDGHVLELEHSAANDLPRVVRDGVAREWAAELDLYRPVGGSHTAISLGWKEGTLRVEAGGHVFTQTVAEDGTVAFKDR